MRIILMGTGPFAVPTCKRLLADGHDIPLVVTRPLVDPNAKKLPPRPVFDWAQSADLSMFEPASINSPDAIEKLNELKADLFFVCDYGQILSKECLEASKLGGINLHGSLLPRHRGAAPVQWSLLRGDTTAGVSVIHMTPRLDAGPTLAVRETSIHDDETAEELEPRLAEIGVDATVDSLKLLSSWDGSSELGQIQDKGLVTKAPRFAKADGALDFRLPADYLVRLIRACQPWPGTFAELAWPDGKKKLRLIIRRARNVAAIPTVNLQAGEARRVSLAELFERDPKFCAESAWSNPEQWSDKWQEVIAVGCSEGVLLISEVQPSGKRLMNAQEFMRGHQVVEGCQFEIARAAENATGFIAVDGFCVSVLPFSPTDSLAFGSQTTMHKSATFGFKRTARRSVPATFGFERTARRSERLIDSEGMGGRHGGACLLLCRYFGARWERRFVSWCARFQSSCRAFLRVPCGWTNSGSGS